MSSTLTACVDIVYGIGLVTASTVSLLGECLLTIDKLEYNQNSINQWTFCKLTLTPVAMSYMTVS